MSLIFQFDLKYLLLKLILKDKNTHTYMIKSSNKLHVVLNAKSKNSWRKSFKFSIDDNMKYGVILEIMHQVF